MVSRKDHCTVLLYDIRHQFIISLEIPLEVKLCFPFVTVHWSLVRSSLRYTHTYVYTQVRLKGGVWAQGQPGYTAPGAIAQGPNGCISPLSAGFKLTPFTGTESGASKPHPRAVFWPLTPPRRLCEYESLSSPTLSFQNPPWNGFVSFSYCFLYRRYYELEMKYMTAKWLPKQDIKHIYLSGL